MNIQKLFDELATLKDKELDDFNPSGLVNRFAEMQYGFFPLGWGKLTNKNKCGGGIPDMEIEEGGVMVLGNDFGTVNYVKNDCNSIGEVEGKTVKNLLDEQIGLKLERTFFTNFYLGLRLQEGRYEGTTMINRLKDGKVNKLEIEYKALCFNFFIKQLNFTNPRLVVCLGHDVKNALNSLRGDIFAKWNTTKSLKYLYEQEDYLLSANDEQFGSRTFMVIPHPCDSRNFKKSHIDALSQELMKHHSFPEKL